MIGGSLKQCAPTHGQADEAAVVAAQEHRHNVVIVVGTVFRAGLTGLPTSHEFGLDSLGQVST